MRAKAENRRLDPVSCRRRVSSSWKEIITIGSMERLGTEAAAQREPDLKVRVATEALGP